MSQSHLIFTRNLINIHTHSHCYSHSWNATDSIRNVSLHFPSPLTYLLHQTKSKLVNTFFTYLFLMLETLSVLIEDSFTRINVYNINLIIFVMLHIFKPKMTDTTPAREPHKRNLDPILLGNIMLLISLLVLLKL